MALTLRNNLYKCTTNSCWICLVWDRILVGKGSRSMGKCAWSRKCDVAQVFKHSDYWKFVVKELKNKHPEYNENDWYDFRGAAKHILRKEYERLKKEGIVRFVEIKPTQE